MIQHSDIDQDAFPWEKAVLQAVHDMRTPLSSMLTTVEVMRQLQASSATGISPQWERVLNSMSRQVDALAEQLSRLQDSPASFLKQEEVSE